jgi:hypothetical protein
MRAGLTAVVVSSILCFAAEPVAAACAPDAVESGTVCIDKYESSIWDLSSVPDSGRVKSRLIAAIRAGTATLASLQAAGAMQVGLTAGDLATAGCPVTGNGCIHVYAVSLAGVMPSARVTWFQAAAAARNSLKRLPTNQEWQVAAFGTPDPGFGADDPAACHINGPLPPNTVISPTGARTGCVSDVGAFDMVGNLSELVAEWADLVDGSVSCGHWPDAFGGDLTCFGGTGTLSPTPGVIFRGGRSNEFNSAGVFHIAATVAPTFSSVNLGFRCVR